MALYFFEEVHEIEPIVSKGSEGKVTQGCAIKKGSHGAGQESWVARNTTLILGCHPEGSSKEIEPSAAEWTFSIDTRIKSNIDGAVVIVCCDRRQGGLHSEKLGALVHVKVNDCEVDIIGLKEKPKGYTDFFHRVTNQDIPDVRQIKHCGTKYSFSVPVDFLNCRSDVDIGHEKVILVIDKETRWDIDYVVLVVNHTRKKVRSWVIAVIFTIFGALASVVFTEVWNFVGRLIE